MDKIKNNQNNNDDQKQKIANFSTYSIKESRKSNGSTQEGNYHQFVKRQTQFCSLDPEQQL